MPELPDPFELFGLEPSVTVPPPPPATPSAAPATTRSVPVSEPPRTVATDDGGAGGDDDYVSVKGGSDGGRGGRWALVIGIPILVVALLIGGAGFWVKGKIDPGNPGDEVAFTVAKGATTSQIATDLAEKKIVSSAGVFEWYVKWKGGDPFQAGDYEGLRINSSMGSVVDILKAGPAPPKTVTFLVREGLWVSEFKKLALEKFPTMDPVSLDAALTTTHPSLQPSDSTNIEGFLYPATYEIAQQNVGNAQKLIDQMVAAFDRVSQAEGLPDASAKLKGVAGTKTITPYEALIVASLVESEAKVDEERPKIARVIYNRLKIGMALQLNATVQYATNSQGQIMLSNKATKINSPYNTYRFAGLPPTPIANPSNDAIEATLNPAIGDWLYFITVAPKDTRFTKDFSEFSEWNTEFNKNVAAGKFK